MAWVVRDSLTLAAVDVVYIESGPCGCRPPIFACREGRVASPAGKPPGEAPNNRLRRSVTFAGHFARNTVGLLMEYLTFFRNLRTILVS